MLWGGLSGSAPTQHCHHSLKDTAYGAAILPVGTAAGMALLPVLQESSHVPQADPRSSCSPKPCLLLLPRTVPWPQAMHSTFPAMMSFPRTDALRCTQSPREL